jgi:hypothetical protein
MHRGLAFASLAALLAGCGTTIEYVPLNSPPHPLVMKAPEAVEMFTTAVPTKPYVEVGTIESRQQAYSGDDTAAIYAKMREEAAARGCDGLVITGSNDATLVSGSTYNGSGSVSSRTLKGYKATCIAYK